MGVVPVASTYTTSTGQVIQVVDGANVGTRTVPGDVWYAVVHLTEGTDSRAYLWKNDRGVSTHYLAGEYDGQIEIYKYASETNEAAYTQGFGVLGRLASYDHGSDWADGTVTLRKIRSLNQVAIGYEIEGTPSRPPSRRLLLAVAAHLAEIITYWHQRGKQVVLLRHLDVDSDKRDPQGVDWTWFCAQVYRQVKV